jgi:hypothetical protein
LHKIFTILKKWIKITAAMPDPFFSELKYLGGANQDFIEIAVDAGTDVFNLDLTVYTSSGTIRSITNGLSGLTPTTVNGKDVYVIENGDATNFSGVAASQGLSLSQDGTVFSFLSFNDNAALVTATEGPANGLTSTDIGQAGAGSSLETTDGGVSYDTQNTPDPGNITCFTTGTHISTKIGPIKVENLAQGMQVLTFDGTYKTLKKLFRKAVSHATLRNNPKLYPVRICAGAMGGGLPHQDILVSRQHRMVVSSPITKRMFDAETVLIAAIKLTKMPSIYVDTSVTSVEYFHLLFDDHEVVFAEGAPSESLFLGAEAVKTLPIDSLQELKTLFPTICAPLEISDSKFCIPSGVRQTNLIRRHLINN